MMNAALIGKTKKVSVCTKVIAMGLVSLAAFCTQAFEWPAKTDCVVLKTKDASNNESSIVNGEHWDPAGVPDPQKDYWADKTLYGPANDTTFDGRSLTVGGTFTGLNGNITFGHLRLLGDSTVVINKNKDGLVGEITVESSAEKPAIVQLSRTGNMTKNPNFKSATSFIADENSVLEFHATGELKQYLCFNSCDLTAFCGTMRVLRDDASLNFGGWLTNAIQGNLVMPGTYQVGGGVKLYRNASAAKIQVDDLVLDSESCVENCTTTPFVTVTNKLQIAENARLALSSFSPSGVDSPKLPRPFIRLKGLAAEESNLPRFAWFKLDNETRIENNFWGLGQFGLMSDEEGDGKDKIVAYRDGRPLVEYTNATAKALATDESNWENQAFPTAEQNGYVASGYYCVGNDKSDDYVFPGGGLVFKKNGHLRPDCATMTISNLFISGGQNLTAELYQSLGEDHVADWQGLSKPTILKGEYVGAYGNFGVSVAYGRELVVNAPLYGSGDVEVATRYKADYPYGGAEFVAINTNWHGRFTVHSDCDPSGTQTDSAKGLRTRLYMTDARNVGGALDEFTYDAFRLRGDSLIVGRNNLTFNQANRGVYIEDRARFVMTNETSNVLEIDEPVTFGGEFVFGNEYPNAQFAPVGKGSGILRLGGEAKFVDGDVVVETPVNDRAKLKMLVGMLQVSSEKALDGVALTFGEESDGLLMDWNSADDVKTKGLVDVKIKEPFASLRPDGEIPVSIANLPEDFNDGSQIAICTVSTDAAATIASLLRPVKPRRGVRVVLKDPVDNADGTATIFMEVSHSGGLMMIFR